MAQQNVMINDLSRMFLFNNGVFVVDPDPEYFARLGVEGLSQDRGEPEDVEVPSVTQYGKFDKVASLAGELSRMTTTLTGRMSRTELSRLYQLFIDDCPVDAQLHFGLCQDPEDFDSFDKAMIFEDVRVTSFSTEALVALQASDRAVVNESVDISIGRYYEVIKLLYGVRGGDVTVDAAIVDVTISDRQNCGTGCDESSNGYNKIFAATADGFVYASADGGLTWESNDASALLDDDPVETIVGAAVYKTAYMLLTSAGNIVYAPKADLIDGTAVFALVDSALTGAGAAINSFGTVAVVAGAAGDIALITDAEGSTELVNSDASVSLGAIGVGEDGTIVVGGASGVVMYSFDGEVWYAATALTATPTVASVLVKSKTNWIVGTTNGKLFGTANSGRTWTQMTYPGWVTNSASIAALEAGTTHVLYMATDDKLYQSANAGSTWVEQPNSTAAFPTNASLNAIAAFGPNFVVVGGVTAAPAGILVVGTV
jgi:hypothetical protein